MEESDRLGDIDVDEVCSILLVFFDIETQVLRNFKQQFLQRSVETTCLAMLRLK
jgi:hypothetical protein